MPIALPVSFYDRGLSVVRPSDADAFSVGRAAAMNTNHVSVSGYRADRTSTFLLSSVLPRGVPWSPVLRAASVRRPVVPRRVPRSRSVRGRPRCCGTYGGRLSRAASMSCSALMMMVPPLVLVMCTAPPFMGRGESDLPQVALFLSSGVDL